MSIAGDLRVMAGRFEAIGEDGMRVVETVFTNPEAIDVMSDLSAVCGYSLPPGTIAAFGAALKGFLGAIAPPAAAAAAVGAGPGQRTL